jgi:Holliday junction resolvase RusA-like endonuclease
MDYGLYEFVIPGKVKGKQRARVFMNENSGKMTAKTPEETVNYENWVKLCFLKNYRKVLPITEAVSVDIVAYFVRPKTNKNSSPITVRTDVDNIAKAVLDALNGLAYIDDKQVCRLSVKKEWSVEESVTVSIGVIR